MGDKSDHPAELLESTAIATALAFFAGWEYARAYYDVFDIRVGMLDIQVPSYFVWAYRPLNEYWYFGAAAIALLTVLNHVRRNAAGWYLYFVNSVLLITLLLLFPAISLASRAIGNKDANANLRSPRDSFPLVTIHLKDPEKASKDAFRSGAGPIHGADYFLLGRHHDTLFLLPFGDSGVPKPILLPSDAVSAVIIRR